MLSLPMHNRRLCTQSAPKRHKTRSLRHVALGRRALGEPPAVGAVVVRHVALPRPPHGLLRRRVHHHVLLPVSTAGSRRGDGREVAVLCHEGRLRPVRLDLPPLRGPVLGVPQAPVHPHRLPRRVRHALVRVVPKLPDRRPVHHHPAKQRTIVNLSAWINGRCRSGDLRLCGLRA